MASSVCPALCQMSLFNYFTVVALSLFMLLLFCSFLHVNVFILSGKNSIEMLHTTDKGNTLL